MLPACFLHVASIFPACTEHVQHVRNSASIDLVAAMWPAWGQHGASMLPGFAEHEQSICRVLEINQLCPAARTEEFSVLFRYVKNNFDFSFELKIRYKCHINVFMKRILDLE